MGWPGLLHERALCCSVLLSQAGIDTLLSVSAFNASCVVDYEIWCAFDLGVFRMRHARTDTLSGKTTMRLAPLVVFYPWCPSTLAHSMAISTVCARRLVRFAYPLTLCLLGRIVTGKVMVYLDPIFSALDLNVTLSISIQTNAVSLHITRSFCIGISVLLLGLGFFRTLPHFQTTALPPRATKPSSSACRLLRFSRYGSLPLLLSHTLRRFLG